MFKVEQDDMLKFLVPTLQRGNAYWSGIIDRCFSKPAHIPQMDHHRYTRPRRSVGARRKLVSMVDLLPFQIGSQGRGDTSRPYRSPIVILREAKRSRRIHEPQCGSCDCAQDDMLKSVQDSRLMFIQIVRQHIVINAAALNLVILGRPLP
jgi:hypothetical protein